MSDKWEVVKGDKKKKKVSNGQPAKPTVAPSQPVPSPSKSNGKVRQRKKWDADYKVKPGDDFHVPEPSGGASNNSSGKPVQTKPKKKPQKQPGSSGSKRGNDLESALDKVSTSELSSFFQELKNAGSAGDVRLSWIKYCADALNTRLNKVPAAECPQWPLEMYFPTLPATLEETIQRIISETVSMSDESLDVLGISYSSLLASLPSLAQRNDPAWGYLIFLREMVMMDPAVVLRRNRSFAELMESYGNKKEVGICCLWVAAQAAFCSANVLRIVMEHIVPYYNFKHYRAFVIAVLAALASAEPTEIINVDAEEFVEFFDMALDPKRKRDFEKFYQRMKHSVINNLRGEGSELLEILLPRLGKSDFLPLSVVGHETLDILASCVDYDTTVLPTWQNLIVQYSRESGVLLNYMAKNVERFQNGAALEIHLFKTSNFASAAGKNPELMRYARRFQEGLKQVQASRKRGRSSLWYIILLLLAGAITLVWFDVQEYGKGVFSKSQSGKFLAKYGLLDDVLYIGERTQSIAKSVGDYCAPHVRTGYERVQPVLQAIDKQLQLYLPKLVEVFQKASEQIVLFGDYLAKEVFVGQLAPENLRKVALDTLALVWSYLEVGMNKVFETVGYLVNYLKAYL